MLSVIVECYFSPISFKGRLGRSYFLTMKVLPSFLRVQLQKHIIHNFFFLMLK